MRMWIIILKYANADAFTINKFMPKGKSQMWMDERKNFHGNYIWKKRDGNILEKEVHALLKVGPESSFIV